MEAASNLDRSDRRSLSLRGGRILTVAPAGEAEVIEVRSGEGMLELRLRMTDDGPVLEMESVRLLLRAAESLDIDAKDINVNAERSMALKSPGEITISGKADVHVDAAGDVHVTGEMIYLN